MALKAKPELGVGWFVECGLQIIAITLCSLILMNMYIEDQQAPRARLAPTTVPCTDYGIPK